MSKIFNTPILLIAFNRPELTQKVLNRIREVNPKFLFVAVDGARENNPSDKEKCQQVKDLVLNFGWKCQVKTLFQGNNLGCKLGPVAAINWFFENVEKGIVLEDDVLADKSFFYYCQELLSKYQNDMSIASISGNNFQFDKQRTADSYYFSRYSHTCGWATWQRAWQLYDVDIKQWAKYKKEKWLSDIFESKLSAYYWKLIFDGVYSGKNDTVWDYQWNFMTWTHNMLSILPNQNLIQNIGFGSSDATHTKRLSPLALNPVKPIKFPLIHPVKVTRDAIADDTTQRNNYILWKEAGMALLRKLVRR